MKVFFVGLLVLLATGLMAVVIILLLPMILVLGFFLKWLILFFLLLSGIWLIGKVTLWGIENAKRNEKKI